MIYLELLTRALAATYNLFYFFQFQNGGVDCVCDVLCENKSSEGARSEAAGLVAQITAPWTEGSGYVLQSINQNAQRLVTSIASKFVFV